MYLGQVLFGVVCALIGWDLHLIVKYLQKEKETDAQKKVRERCDQIDRNKRRARQWEPIEKPVVQQDAYEQITIDKSYYRLTKYEKKKSKFMAKEYCKQRGDFSFTKHADRLSRDPRLRERKLSLLDDKLLDQHVSPVSLSPPPHKITQISPFNLNHSPGINTAQKTMPNITITAPTTNNNPIPQIKTPTTNQLIPSITQQTQSILQNQTKYTMANSEVLIPQEPQVPIEPSSPILEAGQLIQLNREKSQEQPAQVQPAQPTQAIQPAQPTQPIFSMFNIPKTGTEQQPQQSNSLFNNILAAPIPTQPPISQPTPTNEQQQPSIFEAQPIMQAQPQQIAEPMSLPPSTSIFNGLFPAISTNNTNNTQPPPPPTQLFGNLLHCNDKQLNYPQNPPNPANPANPANPTNPTNPTNPPNPPAFGLFAQPSLLTSNVPSTGLFAGIIKQPEQPTANTQQQQSTQPTGLFGNMDANRSAGLFTGLGQSNLNGSLFGPSQPGASLFGGGMGIGNIQATHQ